ncbi:MAG: HAMP domain-containing protein [Myxococcales bacterium]|nr:HAMP domain-containing protein [Myxococcales bacterium]
MKLRLRTIGSRIVLLTSLLIAATVAVLVWQWTSSVRTNVHDSKRDEAIATAQTLSFSVLNQVEDSNWASIRLNVDLLMRDNTELVYVMVHDARNQNRISAAEPKELGERFVPDAVPLSATKAALSTTERRETEVPVLTDVSFLDTVRAHRGDRVLEVAAPVYNVSRERIGTVRIGISLARVAEEVRAAMRNAILLGVVALVLALLGGFLVARTLSRPIQRLAADAAKIAGGDLGHRATVDREDEIGSLAKGFNEMSRDLENSFGKLHLTLASFERFVPRTFLNVVAPEGIENIVVGTAAPRQISVLFTDLRGFTTLCEGLTPMQVFELLNEYLARMGEAIDTAGGFVDKYIGDAIMALFDDEHTDGIVTAIVAMRRALKKLNEERAARGAPPIVSGIGAHCGSVVMGTIGFASKIESTVIGDAVNVASRVEGITKDMKLDVLLTGDVVARLRDPAAFKLRRIEGSVAIRGRAEPIELYTLEDT